MNKLLHILGAIILTFGSLIVFIYSFIFMITPSTISERILGLFMFIFSLMITFSSYIWWKKIKNTQQININDLLPELPDIV